MVSIAAKSCQEVVKDRRMSTVYQRVGHLEPDIPFLCATKFRLAVIFGMMTSGWRAYEATELDYILFLLGMMRPIAFVHALVVSRRGGARGRGYLHRWFCHPRKSYNSLQSEAE